MLTRRQMLFMAAAVSLRSHPARGDDLVVVPVVALSSPLRDLSLALLERVFIGGVVEDAHGRKLIPFNHPPKTVEPSSTAACST